MRRTLPVLLTAVAVALPAVAPTPAQAGPTHRCKVPSRLADNIFRLRAKNTSCTEARRVLGSTRFVRPNLFTARGRAGGYRCPARNNSMEGADIRCSGPGGNLVTWSSGS